MLEKNNIFPKCINDALLFSYEQILLDQDPLPSYGLKLLLALLESNTGFIKQFEKLGLVSVIFQVLLVSFVLFIFFNKAYILARLY